ncbi:sigma 54-interacting transcriptional regulator [Agaribacter flavus]|uniref:Sigma 54-interacting transcriptional regulator n=1 Tax=Agaribacter flavus TaxID=1902781 RepID=A0ABV7FRM9_9ALTE
MSENDFELHELIQGISGYCQCDSINIVEIDGDSTYRYVMGDADLQTQAAAPSVSVKLDFQGLPCSIYCSQLSAFSIQFLLTDKVDAIGSSRRQIDKLEQKTRTITLTMCSHSKLPNWLLALHDTSSLLCDKQRGFVALLSALYSQSQQIREYKHLKTDPLTQLQSKEAMQRAIDTRIKKSPMILCLIHCRDFQLINRKFSQVQGDNVLREIAIVLKENTRDDDIVCRFGGALFGVTAHAQDIQDGYKLACKLKDALEANTYLENAVKLSFSVGLGFCDEKAASEEKATPSIVLINRAEQALKSSQSTEKSSIVLWELGQFEENEQDYNYLGGIFTDNNITNYRNMLLLWDISSIIADEYEFKKLLLHVVQRLAATFHFELAGLVSTQSPNSNVLLSSNDLADVEVVDNIAQTTQDLLLHLAKDAIANNTTIEHYEFDSTYLLLPIGAKHDICFFMSGQQEQFVLSHNTNLLFAGFARQLGRALRRNQLEEALNKSLAQQNAKLAEEVATLKSGLMSSTLVYQSKNMQQLMIQAQRAAKTDTTVLVTGESGTGKERLVHALHSLGSRADKPLIIVDCGSIPESLIESELFGHAKGSFTGAQHEKIGQVQAADGGTLVLDEIGELPMLMQPKLLRFVQEKHFSPVGSTKHISVNVKIIAVTNRDLAQEVKEGRFRQDLYYRLNVIHIHNIPLRERLDDLPLLCQHFLTQFAKRYETPKKHIHPTTLQRMQKYPWPGNIRELENKLMQAYLLSEGDDILVEDLKLPQTVEIAEAATAIQHAQDNKNTSNTLETSSFENTEIQKPAAQNLDVQHTTKNIVEGADTWMNQLTSALNSLLDEVNGSANYYHLNIGELVEQHLFRYCFQTLRTNKKTAEKLQLPISTARRKIQRANTQKMQQTLPLNWHRVAKSLENLVDADWVVIEPLNVIKQQLLESILSKNTQNMTRAAAQLGVSEPTLYKLKKQL